MPAQRRHGDPQWPDLRQLADDLTEHGIPALSIDGDDDDVIVVLPDGSYELNSMLDDDHDPIIEVTVRDGFHSASELFYVAPLHLFDTVPVLRRDIADFIARNIRH